MERALKQHSETLLMIIDDHWLVFNGTFSTKNAIPCPAKVKVC